jgi:hypothetical protein
MRNKLYYTIDEITKNLFTGGAEFMTTDNVEYKGAYHRYITNELYTQGDWNNRLSKKLIPFKTQQDRDVVYTALKRNILPKYKEPYSAVVNINSGDLKRGYIFRYFISKINSSNVMEIDAVTYHNWENKTIDPTAYTAVKMRWYITGNIADVESNGITSLGVNTQNGRQVVQASITIPTISDHLTNLIEFYTDVDFNIPKDINS